MRTLLFAGATVQRVLEGHGWRSCFIGGIANYRWGTPRLTNDLDVTLLAGFGNEGVYAEVLLSEFESRIPDAAEFAAANRVVLLRTREGFGLDIALGALPFEERTIERSSSYEFLPGASLRTCAAEDLIVHKAFAARPQDWVDVEGVITKQRGALEWRQIRSELGALAEIKGEPELMGQLERIADRVAEVIGDFPRS